MGLAKADATWRVWDTMGVGPRRRDLRIAKRALGVRDTADEWPPRYTSWKAG